MTLLNANINGDKTLPTGEYAGLTCLGDATITIVGTNSVSGFIADNSTSGFPGIYVPSGKTLIINGTGSLMAQSSAGYAAGIGARVNTHCGNIEIQSGKITAIGGERAAGIGGAYNANGGNITISGGIVTATGGAQGPGIGGGRRGGSTDAGHGGNILISGGVVSATSGADAAAIGGGRGNNKNYLTKCGTITITNTALKVYAHQGGGSTNTIGAAKYGNCGTVTIGGNTGVINADPYTYRTKEDGEIVVDYINAIGTVVYTQECKDKIDIARELYDALEDSQIDLVTNYQTLLDAEAAYAALIPQPVVNLKLIEFQVPASWENDNTPISIADFPDFVATTYEIASALPVTSEPSLVVFDFPGDEVSVYSKMGGEVSKASTGSIKREVFFENTEVHYYYPVLAGDDPQPTGVENVQTNQVQATKFFRDGQILILRDGKTYTVTGQQVR